jgi:hypothetical protein
LAEIDADHDAVSAEIKELFQHITRYKAHNIELETRMRPFMNRLAAC